MRIYCVGSLNVDFVFMCDRWPGEHEKLHAHNYMVSGGGAAANAAVELARLGWSVSLITAVGSDMLGTFAQNDLTMAGVDTSRVLVDDQWKTGCAAIRSTENSKSILTAGYVNPAAVFEILTELSIGRGDHVHLSWAPPDSMTQLLDDWRIAGVTLSWETNGRFNCAQAELMDVVFMNYDERRRCESGGYLSQNWLTSKSLRTAVVVTLGPIGAEAYIGGDRFFHKANKVEVVDRTGGGDAFDAGFLDAWLSAKPLDECLHCGLQSAANVLARVGSRLGAKV